jgi:uncharacterized peroxidase-related enzyme
MTATSTPVRETFTLDLLEWTPWIERATDTDLPQERKDEIRAFIGDGPATDYVNVLANDFEALKTRALVHRHVYSSTDPEPTAWRELGATTTSRINGCVFCASVHARMYAAATKRRDVIQTFLDEGLDAKLPPIERAIVDLSAKVTLEPESLSATDLQPLRDLGLDDITILDTINYAAFFANANRLMLTLGEPRPATKR